MLIVRDECFVLYAAAQVLSFPQQKIIGVTDEVGVEKRLILLRQLVIPATFDDYIFLGSAEKCDLFGLASLFNFQKAIQ